MCIIESDYIVSFNYQNNRVRPNEKYAIRHRFFNFNFNFYLKRPVVKTTQRAQEFDNRCAKSAVLWELYSQMGQHIPLLISSKRCYVAYR